MFRSDQSGKRANLIFWIDDVPTPSPQVEGPDGGSLDAAVNGIGLRSCGDEENVVRGHVVWG